MFRDDAAANRYQRLLNASWPLFRAFGVDVRVHWAIVLVPLVLFWLFVTAFTPDPPAIREWYSQPGVHWQESAAWALVWTFALYLVDWTHEMAHAVVGRRFGVATRRVALRPFGVLVHRSAPMPDARADFWTAFAGPASQIAWAVLFVVPYLLLDVEGRAFDATNAVGVHRWPEMFRVFLYLQLAVGAFNLLPVFPLDGGRCVRAAFASRMTAPSAMRWTTYVGYPGAIMLSIAGAWMLVYRDAFALPPWSRFVAFTLIGVGLTSFMHCRSLQIEANEMESAELAAPAWKHSRAPEPWKDTIAESERLARAEERRERRAAEARRQEELQRHKIQERIDELLDRINEVGGVENLTSAERRELAEASEMLRRETAEG